MKDKKRDYSFDSLPYIFKDPLKIDKKIDVKKLSFGSKIDGTYNKRDDLFSVKKVLSPDRIELNTGLVIKLIGIKANPKYTEQAVAYLNKKFNKRKVYIKYDLTKYDNDNNLMCYLYLDNKTFINRHLLKTGYVYLDCSMDYKYKKTFMEDLTNA